MGVWVLALFLMSSQSSLGSQRSSRSQTKVYCVTQCINPAHNDWDAVWVLNEICTRDYATSEELPDVYQACYECGGSGLEDFYYDDYVGSNGNARGSRLNPYIALQDLTKFGVEGVIGACVSDLREIGWDGAFVEKWKKPRNWQKYFASDTEEEEEEEEDDAEMEKEQDDESFDMEDDETGSLNSSNLFNEEQALHLTCNDCGSNLLVKLVCLHLCCLFCTMRTFNNEVPSMCIQCDIDLANGILNDEDSVHLFEEEDNQDL